MEPMLPYPLSQVCVGYHCLNVFVKGEILESRDVTVTLTDMFLTPPQTERSSQLPDE
jgi:hypothetical protein